jgi:2-amino-4-hydroxy-6-hydroxymethyldihydropteridine diphosphokinase
LCAKISDLDVNHALIALGGNLNSPFGSALETVDFAIDTLASLGVEVTVASRAFKTPCFPAGQGPDFVNQVIEVAIRHEPEALLGLLHEVEAKFGRVRSARWNARPLDLDLLSYDQLVLPSVIGQQTWVDLALEEQMAQAPSELILPHPRLQDRGFVLIPLCDIRPDWVHPVLGKTARELRDALPACQFEGVEPV